MLNLSPMEIVFVMVVLLLLFGGKRLPELGGSLGKGIREFKRTMHEVNSDLRDNVAGQVRQPDAWPPVRPPAPQPVVEPVRRDATEG